MTSGNSRSPSSTPATMPVLLWRPADRIDGARAAMLPLVLRVRGDRLQLDLAAARSQHPVGLQRLFGASR